MKQISKMKKLILICCLAFGTAVAANAQSSSASADAAKDVVKGNPKSCCATMAEAKEKGCTDAFKASTASTDATKAETAPATQTAAAAPKAASCCSAKTAQAGEKQCAGKAMAQAEKEKAEAKKEN